jgi:hypothetical protein
VTALGLTGLLLIASPSSLHAAPAEATRTASAVSAPAEEKVTEAQKASASSDGGKRARAPKPVRSEELTFTGLDEPANGARAVRRLGDELPAVARANDLSAAELRTTLRTDETLWVAPSGHLFVKEEVHGGGTFAGAEVAEPTAPLAETLDLHSLPGSRLVIHLDFDGVDVPASSLWSTQQGLAPGAYEGWDPMGDGAAFSADERAAIQEIWERVAEDFAPFDVDVTTADPGDAALRYSGAGDTAFGTRVVISDSTAAPAQLCNSGCGGVAWIGLVNQTWSVAEPAWVFAELNSQVPRAIAEAASHEVGHTFGLNHDGHLGDDYYSGHGTWAPIMGAAYGVPVSQWSAGAYSGATNTEDDVAKIRAIAGPRIDEGGDGWTSPLSPPDGTAYVNGTGDRDVYLLDDCTADARAAAVTSGFAANLDVRLTLAAPDGTSATPLTSVNPLVAKVDGGDTRPWYGGTYLSSSATGLDASVDVPEGGPWLLEVRGDEGLTSDTGASDYPTYGSLGAYDLKVQGCDAPVVAPASPTGLALSVSGADLVASWTAPTNDGGSPLTGYRVTLNGQTPVDVAADVTTHTFAGAASAAATVTVSALNAAGASAVATATATPSTVPGKVVGVSVATEGITCDFDGQAVRGIEVSWWAPPTDGGSPLTGYELWQGQGGEFWKLFPLDPSGQGKRVCFNPSASEPYDYRIVALNANGAGEPYEFSALLAGPPKRITPTVTTDRDDRTVTVTWVTPFDGGAPIERVHLTLTDGVYGNPVDVVLPRDATSYTFTAVRTGPKHVLIAAANEWGPSRAGSGLRNTHDEFFEMPPISPVPPSVSSASIRTLVLSTDPNAGTGDLRVSWDAAVPGDPEHDPILWYDVCVGEIGDVAGITVPGDPIFGDGTTRGTDLCRDGTLAFTADASDDPFIDLTGLPLGDQYVSITPVNPGGPTYLPAMRLVNFDPTSITCPTWSVSNGMLSGTWQWTTMNVNYWKVRARKLPDSVWTTWATGQAYYMTGVYNQSVTPGQWEVEVTAHLRSGYDGPPVVCAVTVPEATTPEPTPEPTPDPTPEPTPDPTTPPVPPTTVPPTVPTTGTDPVPTPATPTAPAALRAPSAKPGSKGGAKTVTLKWAAPASASGPVTGYEVVVHKMKGSKAVKVGRKTVSASKRTLVLKLKAGSYRFTVRARNATGWGAPSGLSKAVTPR